MRFLSGKTNIDFVGKRKIAFVVSLTLIVLSIATLATRGLNFGLDFTGGTLIEVGYPAAPDISEVRDNLKSQGLDDAVVQTFGVATEIVVRIPPREQEDSDAELSTVVLQALSQGVEGDVEMRRVEFVGPQVGDELTQDGGLAMLYALIGILIYVMLRFEWRFAVGSVIALIHDVIFTLGIFSLLQIEFDLPVLAAVLAVIGYSLNDTIVVYDRIRENFRKMRKGNSEQIINASLNQTLSRTLVTSLTTLLVLFALFIFGGKIIHGFALALIIGVVIGTYSSIYVASTAVLSLGISKDDMMPVKKEGAETEGQS